MPEFDQHPEWDLDEDFADDLAELDEFDEQSDRVDA